MRGSSRRLDPRLPAGEPDGELHGRTIDDLDTDQEELLAPIGSIVKSTFFVNF